MVAFNCFAEPDVPPDPKGIGFAPLWLIFAAGNRSESNFHYLGMQKVEGHATYVITFAQVPAQVRKPSLLATATDTIPLLYQGVAWIDASDFQILRLRTDLLAPLPQLGLDRVTYHRIRSGPHSRPDRTALATATGRTALADQWPRGRRNPPLLQVPALPRHHQAAPIAETTLPTPIDNL